MAHEPTTRRKAPRVPPRLTGTELAVLALVEDLLDDLGYAPTYAQVLDRLSLVAEIERLAARIPRASATAMA